MPLPSVLAPQILIAASAALAVSPPTGDVDALGWMAGYWLDCSGGREVSEVWSDPRAGLIAGTGVTLRNGRAGFEASHIRRDAEGHVTYFAQPGGAAPTPFRLVDQGEAHARFENAQNDFPNVITYRLEGDVLHAQIDGQINGAPRAVQWRFERAELNARCPD